MTQAAAPFTLPPIEWPDLPVSARRDEIAEAIRNHQVIVVCGETDSGKTTQLPKILLSIGRGQKGMIGHTQPRRLAARTVAQRIAEELNTPLGELVGYSVGKGDSSQKRITFELERLRHTSEKDRPHVGAAE